MKNPKSRGIFILIVTCSLIGCASTGFLMAKPRVVSFINTFDAKESGSIVDVYLTTKPEKEYIEIAQISCSDTDDSWNLEQILLKAREIGADAIIIIGKAGELGAGVPIGNMTYVSTREYGITAIAIKYK